MKMAAASLDKIDSSNWYALQRLTRNVHKFSTRFIPFARQVITLINNGKAISFINVNKYRKIMRNRKWTLFFSYNKPAAMAHKNSMDKYLKGDQMECGALCCAFLCVDNAMLMYDHQTLLCHSSVWVQMGSCFIFSLSLANSPTYDAERIHILLPWIANYCRFLFYLFVFVFVCAAQRATRYLTHMSNAERCFAA